MSKINVQHTTCKHTFYTQNLSFAQKGMKIQTFTTCMYQTCGERRQTQTAFVVFQICNGHFLKNIKYHF